MVSLPADVLWGSFVTHSFLPHGVSILAEIFFFLERGINLAPVVQTLDSAIRRINHYPADKDYGNQLRYPLGSDLSGG